MMISSLSSFRPLFLILLFPLVSACDSSGSDDGSPTGVSAFEMNERLGRGVNFGNALEAPNEGEWGITLEALHFQRAAEAGFETIRLPIRWSAHAMPGPPYTISSGFFARIDWAIDRALENGLNIIINVHHYEGLDADPENHTDRWLAIWKQIAERYKSRPDSVLFELMNEPHDQLTATVWNGLIVQGLNVIRESNPVRNVVIGPVSWNNTDALSSLRLPDDDHIIVTVHMYEPFQFTHQGAEWASGSDAWRGTRWSGTPQQRAFVTNILTRAANWGEQHNRPMFVGEFGAYSAADMESRALWTAHVARECERLGMSWAYWEFMSGFGLYAPSVDIFREELKEALVPPDGG